MQINPINTYKPNYTQTKQLSTFRGVQQVSADSFSHLERIILKEYRHSFLPSFQLYPTLVKYLASTKTLKETDIKGVLAKGGLSAILDLGDKGVLKCSLENPLEYRKHYSKLDIPFLSKVKKIDDMFFVQMVKADCENVTRKDFNIVLKNIKKCGLEPSPDMRRLEQVGIHNGKPYLLDTRCARPKPNLFSRFVNNFCDRHQRVFYVNRPEDVEKETIELYKKIGPKALHIDESPRNIGFIEGCKKIFDIIKQNMKHGYW